MIRTPEQCAHMTEVRAGVDAIDRALMDLFARRFAYMDAAARIKTERGLVRDEARKAEVVANARALAETAGLPADAVAELWDRLVEASIAYELDAWDRLKPGAASPPQAPIARRGTS